ncbi:MAG: response regulator [Bacteroidota bacterium]|nr:response regulator [Bacteroidota bacterium]
MEHKKLSILCIDDNDDHIEILKRAFEKADPDITFSSFHDGEKVMSAFHSWGGAVYPDLIFLDLNLPGRDGQDILKFLKQSERFRHIPVIVLSSSERMEDVRHAYQLGANTFLSKSIVFGDFFAAVVAVYEYWSAIALLPS